MVGDPTNIHHGRSWWWLNLGIWNVFSNLNDFMFLWFCSKTLCISLAFWADCNPKSAWINFGKEKRKKNRDCCCSLFWRVPSNVFNWQYKTQSSKQRVIASFARLVGMSSITLTSQSKGKKGRKEVDGWHQDRVSLLLAPVHSNEE